jgi:hypothetical protein
MRMDKAQKDLAKVIENYFGADAGYLDIDCFTLARRIMEAGWTKPVPCKDCKYKRHNRKYDVILCGHDIGVRGLLKPDDFCSYGERREGE